MKAKRYRCFKCRKTFEVTNFWKWLAAPHFDPWGIRYFKCPNCNNKNWAERVKE